MKPQLSPKEVQELYNISSDADSFLNIAEKVRQTEFLNGEDPSEPIYLKDYEIAIN